MRAAILAIGSELLGTDRLDTNSLKLTASFERFGVEVAVKSVVGDSEAAIAEELRHRLAQVDVVVVTGGLGPTADDVTRHAAARALDRGYAIDESLVEALRRRYARYGREMPEVNRQQAEVIDGARVLDNPLGSAPGLCLDGAEGTGTLFLFPGVPREMEGMVEHHLAPWLVERCDPGAGLERRTLRVACMPESSLEERILPAYTRFGRENISILASPAEVRLVMSARGPAAERRQTLDTMQAALTDLAGAEVFTDRAEESLEAVVGGLLRAAGATLTTAESCTGGLVSQRLTAVPGSSAFFLGGAVTYSNGLKHQLLGVPMDLFDTHGAVSEPVARAMARGVCDRLGSDYGLSITGIAGPGGGTDEKPVGTVHMAVAGPPLPGLSLVDSLGAVADVDLGAVDADGVQHLRMRFHGDRDRVRWQSAQWVLEMLRRRLLAAEASGG